MPLSTNWRQSGDFYLSSRDGDDLNSGTAQNAPKQTLAETFALWSNVDAANIIVRSGYYTYDNSIVSGSHNLISDGLTVLDGSGIFPVINFGDDDVGKHFEGWYIINCDTIKGDGQIRSRCVTFSKCVVKDSINLDLRANPTHQITLNMFINCSVAFKVIYASNNHFRNTFINTSIEVDYAISENQNFGNSYFSEDSSLTVIGSSNTVVFNNCGFGQDVSGFTIGGTQIGSITLNGDSNPISTEYSDGQVFSGTYVDGSGNAFIFNNSFYVADPLFTDSTNELFYLQNTPTQSRLYNSNNIVGRYGLGELLNCNHPHFDAGNGANYANVSCNVGTGHFELTTNPAILQGFVEGAVDVQYAVDLGAVVTITDEILFSLLGFNFFNGEWVDDANYQAGVNDEVRLTFQLQIWNENTASWGAIQFFEINQAPTVDGSGRGNGNVDVDFANESAISGRYLRFARISLRKDGV
ncbi:MAG: hypothetical protein HRT61_00925 [Ekhidna sp.]|nr:hypothetical protein [Ekhidna sp.]